MLFFIPAWYQQGQWCENEQNWYKRRMHTEFDDTVKQVQLFHRSMVYPFEILLLSFAPNFRHFLHRQGVSRVRYWSCFDAIQEVRRRKPMILSFHNLKWPAQIEFVYSPFVVLAMLQGKKYAQIEFGEDGNPIQVDLYEGGMICRRNIYDDRGFVAATVIYEEGRPLYQDYLTENGKWKIRQYFNDGHVIVNPTFSSYLIQYQEQEEIRYFSRESYENMDQILYEVLTAYLELTDITDIFCAAVHEQHMHLLGEALRERKAIWSFFGDRYPLKKQVEVRETLEHADYLITDSAETMRKVKKIGVKNRYIADITPYDSRVDTGISLEFDVQKLLVPVDGYKSEEFDRLIVCLGNYLLHNREARIHLFTRQGEWDRKERLLERTRRSLHKAGLPMELAGEEVPKGDSENNLEEEGISIKFFVEQCVDELAVSKCMREQRLVVDLRSCPELYLQITAISMGIPQIVRVKTQFVENGENGIILKRLSCLQKSLDFYLDGLVHWNEAKIRAYEIGKEYTADKLLEAWREVIDHVGRNTRLTIRR